MEIRKGSSLSRVEIARARLQYYGRASVEAAWEQMVCNGFAAELEAADARREIDRRRKKRTSCAPRMASVPEIPGAAGNHERTYKRSTSHARTLQSVRRGAQVDRYGQRIFDASKHPRAPAGRPDGGQFIEVRGATGRDAARNVGRVDNGTIKRAVPLPQRERERTPVASRMDSLWQGTGVFWDVDGRPWELSSLDIRDWKAITERGGWKEGLNAVAPMFWTSIPEFEAEVKRKARSYRDRMLLVEGSPNPIDVFKRRSERTQTALLADAEEAFTTIDNATSFAGFAKAPLKAGMKSVFRTAKGRAAQAISKDVAKAASKTKLLKRPEHIPSFEGLDLEKIRVALDNGNPDELRWLRMMVEEAIEQRKLSVVSPRSALIRKAGDAEHHIFLEKHRAWFEKRYDIDVDEFMVDVDDLTHQALHSGKSKQALNDNTGWWGYELMRQIRRAEAPLGRGGKLTKEQVIDIGLELRDRFNIKHLGVHAKKKRKRRR